jgi:hypothetical protein
MTVPKRKAMHEPLLNTVARKLGHAAGTVAKATQELTENLSAIPENVTAELRAFQSAYSASQDQEQEQEKDSPHHSDASRRQFKKPEVTEKQIASKSAEGLQLEEMK